MMNMKKLLALLLAIVMVVGMFPMGVLAGETETPDAIICENCRAEGHTAADCEACTECKQTETHAEGCTLAPLSENSEDPKPCGTCGKIDCTSDHTNWCAECKVDSCGIDHSAPEPCGTCGKIDCASDHTTWCAECKVDSCGIDHNAPVCPGTTACNIEGCENEHTKVCSCDPAPAEGAAHTEGCDFYTAPIVDTCADCKGAHKTEDCPLCDECHQLEHTTDCSLYCAFCGQTPCICKVCTNEQCKVKNGHVADCPLRPCTECTDDPCSCEKNCEYCGVELTEGAEHKEDCLSLCTCDPKPAEGEKHGEDCKFYGEDIFDYVGVERDGPIADEEKYYTPVNYTNAAKLLEFVPLMRTFRMQKASTIRKDNPHLHTKKTVTGDAAAGYNIRIEAFLEGNPSTKERYPSDIVLVVDQSTSMSYCFECGSSSGLMEFTAVGNGIDTAGMDSNTNWYRVDHDLDPSTQRIKVFYCPGNTVVGFEDCGHSMGGWFSIDHADPDSSGTGTRYVPTIQEPTMNTDAFHKHIDGGNQNIHARVFYSGLTAGSAVNKNITSTGVYYLDVNQDSYLDDCEKMKFCPYHAAWHFADAEQCTATNPNIEWYVPRNDKSEKCLGTNRFMYVNLSHHKFTTNSELKTSEKYWVKKSGNDTKRGDTYIQVSYKSGSWKGTDNKTYTVASADGESASGQRIFYKRCSEYGSRYQAALESLNVFTNSINTYSEKYNVQNRIAVVTFASPGNSAVQSYASGSTVTPVVKADADANTYKKALHFVNTDSGQNIIKTAINSIHDHGGGTYTHYGLQMANSILENAPTVQADLDKNLIRNKVVILFTDGQPQVGSTTDDPYGGADRALKEAYNIKQQQKATLYSIGIFSNADASTLSYVTKDTVANSSGYITTSDSVNKLMNLISSNYSGRATMADNYQISALVQGYYLSAGNKQGLMDAFLQIAEKINSGSAIDMDETTVVKDVITPYFQIETDGEISIHTEKCTGIDADGKFTFIDDNSEALDKTIVRKPSTDERIIEIDGFDFNEYYVAIDTATDTPVARGRKLVIEIPIAPSPDFLGGDGVPTNTTAAGVYTQNGTIIEQFEVPTANVDVKRMEPEFSNGSIYLGQIAEIPHVTKIGQFKGTDGKPYTVDGTRNAYVDIEYIVSDTNGNSMSYTIDAGQTSGKWEKKTGTGLEMEKALLEDTPYHVECIVTSTGNASNKEEFDADKTVYVFKPEIVFRDSIMNLGQTANYDGADPTNPVTKNLVSVEWKHTGALPEGATANLGVAPNLVFEYDKSAAAFTSDTPVKVTSITAAETDGMTHDLAANFDYLVKVPSAVTFYRDACGFGACTHTTKQLVSATDANRVNFIVHLNTFDLIINKSGTSVIDDNDFESQSYLFRLTRDDGFSLDVVIVEDGTARIKGLLRSKYKVEELSDWSWRYETSNPSIGYIEFDADDIAANGTYEANFVNDRKNPYWLSGDSYCRNFWSGTGIQQTFDPVPTN